MGVRLPRWKTCQFAPLVRIAHSTSSGGVKQSHALSSNQGVPQGCASHTRPDRIRGVGGPSPDRLRLSATRARARGGCVRCLSGDIVGSRPGGSPAGTGQAAV
jgi:hypothetical protein